MKQANLNESGMLDMMDGEWECADKDMRKMMGIYPNFMYRNLKQRQWVLAARPSTSGRVDYFLSQRGLQTAILHHGGRHFDQAYVALLDSRGQEVVAQDTALKIRKALRFDKPISGKYGPYWVINKNFQVVETVNPAFLDNREHF